MSAVVWSCYDID